MGGGGEGLLQGRRPRLHLPGIDQVDRRRAPLQGRQGRRHAVVRARPHLGRELRLPLDRRGRRLQGQGPALCRRLFGAPSGVFVPADSPVKKPEDLAGVPIAVGYQSGSHYSTIQALEQYMPADKINLTLCRRHAVPPARPADRRQGAGLRAVQRPLLLRRAARLPQDHRHDLHDRHHGHRRSRTRKTCASSSARCSARSATSICGPISTPTTTRTNSRRAITP